jgi:hypothetical protein
MSLIYLKSCLYRPPDAPRKGSKALGDPPAQIATQSMATYVHDLSATDLETFMTLARRYVFEGRDRTDICAYNSGVKPFSLPWRFETALIYYFRLLLQQVTNLPPNFGCSSVLH